MTSDNRPMHPFLEWLEILANRALRAYAWGCALFMNGSGYDSPQS